MNTGQTAGVALLVAAFTQEKAGKAVLTAMEKAKKEKQIYFDAAAVITQDTNGKVHYNETDDMATSKGASWGALVGGLIGILGGPAGVVGGAGAGAFIGGLASHGDAGFTDDNLKQLGSALNPGTSAVITISNIDFLKTLHENVGEDELRATVGNLAKQIADQLNEGQDVIREVFVTEKGTIMEQMAVDSTTIKVITDAAASVTNA